MLFSDEEIARVRDLLQGETSRLIEDLPEDIYHSLIGAVSSHGLGAMSESPLACYDKLITPSKVTDAMVLGSLTHSVYLSNTTGDVWIVPEDLRGQKKEVKEQREQLIKIYGDRWVYQSDLDEILERKKVYDSHQSVKNTVIPNIELVELSILWLDRETELYRRSRLDAYGFRKKINIDLKTTSKWSERELQTAIKSYGYHNQLATYREAMRAVGHDVEHSLIVWIKTTRPYDVAVWRIPDADIEQGHRENRERLKLFAECLHTNNWPGKYPSTVELGLPSWAVDNQGETENE